MGVTVGANGMSVIHASSNGIASAFPDTCNTPSPGGPVPIPYPNIARSSDTASGTKDVKCDGQPICHSGSNFSTSTGDEAGNSPGGVVSSKIKGKATFVNFSFDVKVEGKNVTRAFDLVLQNDNNTPPFPVMQPPVIVLVMCDDPLCGVCDKAY